jgi:DNA-binding Xre family transcriptional regulator
MPHIPTTAEATVQKSKVKKIPRGQGRRVKQGTVLACVMTQRRIRKHRITAILHCSDRGLYDMMASRRAVPTLHLGALCDFLDMDPEELIDERNYLLEG